MLIAICEPVTVRVDHFLLQAFQGVYLYCDGAFYEGRTYDSI